MRIPKLLTLGVVAATCLLAVAPVQAIENVKGKEYHLTPKHGPWMIMVTSFRNVRDPEMKKEGLTAEQAAAELVFELREKGIPAYTYAQDAVKGELDTHNRLGREDRRIYAAQRDMICVLAGNYESIEDSVGQKTLTLIKKFQPKFLKDSKNGAILRPDAVQRGPLAGAFMTINPLRDPADIVQKTVDKETKYLNTGIEYSLVKNPHKYTVLVAKFEGKSATPLGNSTFRTKATSFDVHLQENRSGFNILRAGEDAEQLVRLLRNKKSQSGVTQVSHTDNVGLDEAYVYHDKFQSIVTIGGFDSPDDPRIRVIAQYYGQKLVPDLRLLPPSKRTRDASVTADDIDKLPKILTTHTESLYPKNATPDTMPVHIWSFEAEPKVIPVPRLK